MLTERQMLILQVIIDEFIETAHPIGSRAIAKKGSIPYSAATIRNDMADLEEKGLLVKTHSSSGRIPSEKGYRYYVDHIVASISGQSDKYIIKDLIQDGFYEFEQIVQLSAEVLSELTNYTSIILGPEMVETKLKQIQMITLTPHTAVVILVTNTGHVEHRTITIPSEIDPSDLEKMVNIINHHLAGSPVISLPELFNSEIISMMKKYMDDFDQSYHYLKTAFLAEQPVKLYIGGVSNILMQPEFNDVEKIRTFLTMMEKEDEIATLLKQTNDGINVTIGQENEVEAIKDFSLITSTYRLDDGQHGTIALLGPTRMEYKRVISLLKVLSNEMTEALYMWYKNNG